VQAAIVSPELLKRASVDLPIPVEKLTAGDLVPWLKRSGSDYSH
jgi:hypothetical protein